MSAGFFFEEQIGSMSGKPGRERYTRAADQARLALMGMLR